MAANAMTSDNDPLTRDRRDGWHRFVRLTKIGCVAVALILIGLALFVA